MLNRIWLTFLAWLKGLPWALALGAILLMNLWLAITAPKGGIDWRGMILADIILAPIVIITWKLGSGKGQAGSR